MHSLASHLRLIILANRILASNAKNASKANELSRRFLLVQGGASRERLTLRELEAAAGLAATVLLTFDHSIVTAQEAAR